MMRKSLLPLCNFTLNFTIFDVKSLIIENILSPIGDPTKQTLWQDACYLLYVNNAAEKKCLE
jgi:hypothetical protein